MALNGVNMFLAFTGQEYVLEISEVNSDNKWTVNRRYTDFRTLHQAVEGMIGNSPELEFPKKKITGSMSKQKHFCLLSHGK